MNRSLLVLVILCVIVLFPFLWLTSSNQKVLFDNENKSLLHPIDLNIVSDKYDEYDKYYIYDYRDNPNFVDENPYHPILYKKTLYG